MGSMSSAAARSTPRARPRKPLRKLTITPRRTRLDLAAGLPTKLQPTDRSVNERRLTRVVGFSGRKPLGAKLATPRVFFSFCRGPNRSRGSQPRKRLMPGRGRPLGGARKSRGPVFCCAGSVSSFYSRAGRLAPWDTEGFRPDRRPPPHPRANQCRFADTKRPAKASTILHAETQPPHLFPFARLRPRTELDRVFRRGADRSPRPARSEQARPRRNSRPPTLPLVHIDLMQLGPPLFALADAPGPVLIECRPFPN